MISIAGIAFVISLFCIVADTTGQSPCPNFFRYVRDGTTNEIIGQVEIPNPPRGVALHLQVGLSLPAALPSKYVGRLELAQSKEESVRAVQAGRPLRYRILFPLRHPRPVLTGLWFNQHQYCSGPRAGGQIVTSIVLEHTLFPPGILPVSFAGNSGNNGNNGNDLQPARPNVEAPTYSRPQQPPSFPAPSQSPPTVYRPPPPAPTPYNDSSIFFDPNRGNEVDCGRSNANPNKINLLIAGGNKTSPGQWPWMVAIFIVKIEFEFQCAGTLITDRHVITAAHCFKLDDVDVPESTLLVSVGRYRLRDWRERGSVNREVARYVIHPDYRHQGSADSDIAVMQLRESVKFSDRIKPICLWTGSQLLSEIVGKSGYVVGWGRDEFGNPYLAEPRMTKVPIVSQEECLWSNANFVAFTSNRTFCAGSRNGSGPCNGDSGSGLVIRDPVSERFYLRGVVSRSLLDSNTMSCDLTQYVVYVDVARHVDWIQARIAT